MQWVFVFLAFLLIVVVIFPEYLTQRMLWWFLAGSLVIVVFEVLDELNYIGKIKLKLSPAFRLISHLTAWIIAIYLWGIQIPEFIIWQNIIEVPQRSFVLFFSFWSVLCINAINWFDWVYAQASWVSSIGFLTIFLLIKFVVLKHYTNISLDKGDVLLFVQNMSFVLFTLSLLATIVEYKPLALLRDVWTMFFGFGIAYFSVVGWVKIWTLLVVLSLVIFDALRVGIHRKLVLKKSMMKWDYRHLHYRLLRLGRNKWEVRSFVWIFSLVMMTLMLLQWTNRTNKIIIFSVMFILFFGINAYLFWKKKLPCGFEENK